MNQRMGMAPTPKQMEAIRDAKIAAGLIQGPDLEGDIQREVVEKDIESTSDIPEGTPLGLVHEIKNIIYGIHWQHQKQIFDLVQAAIGHHELQWPVVRKLMMEVSTAQIKTTLKLVTQRFRQEMMMQENVNAGSKFERASEDDRGSEGSVTTVAGPERIFTPGSVQQ